MITQNKVQPGIEVAAKTGFAMLKHAQFGVLANQASVDTQGRHLVKLIQQCGQGNMTKLFAPEHGYRGQAQDMEPVANEKEPLAGVEVVSLYGQSPGSLKPSPERFEDLDFLLVDLPDIGTRYYTYAQTMAYCMEAARLAGVKVVVLDRPNPIGGNQFEGSSMSSACRSFCGIGPIANRHGFTLGELARLFQQGFGEGNSAIQPHPCELEVIFVQGWDRALYQDETGITWVKPSPNMRSLTAALTYPGTCLFEATNLSEGRGTDTPFEVLGAPFIDPEAWIDAAYKTGIPMEGVRLEPITFTPSFQKHAGQVCRGIRIQVEERDTFKPYRLGIALLIAAGRTFNGSFQWRAEPYEFIADIPAIDLLYGSNTLRQVVEGRASIEILVEELEVFEGWYASARQDYLLY